MVRITHKLNKVIVVLYLMTIFMERLIGKKIREKKSRITIHFFFLIRKKIKGKRKRN